MFKVLTGAGIALAKEGLGIARQFLVTGKGSVLVNFGAICSKFGRAPEHVAAFFQAELGKMGGPSTRN